MQDNLKSFITSLATMLIKSLGIKVMLSTRVQLDEFSDNTLGTRLKLSDGSSIYADKVINTSSSHGPSTDFIPTAAMNAHGYITVRPT